ncbi:MAG: prolyl aminopeptidase [Chloroflexi bacterium]|nr:prolyl aminopeptidase [Chloroflexota bacterium]MDA1145569.1 prolyl aminopeptidase [Chloroflexota bacterium]
MPDLYPEPALDDHGTLEVGDGHALYWESCGNPEGKAALVLHGGPGSGCTPWHRRLFDPARYRVVLFDQRNCGRSTPHASTPDVDLSANTTQHLVADIERLREHLGIERWLILGGSWGSTLALAYAEAHPARVSELVLFGVTAGQHAEVDWVFRGGLAARFPAQWERLRDAVLPAGDRDGDVLAAVHRLLFDPDPEVRERAATEWCLWESASPDWPPKTELAPRFPDPAYALAFARIVTHYALHYLWLEDGALLEGASALTEIPAVLINGEHDAQTTDAAEKLARRMPLAEHVLVKDAGHAAGNSGIASAIVAATDRFAST